MLSAAAITGTACYLVHLSCSQAADQVRLARERRSPAVYGEVCLHHLLLEDVGRPLVMTSGNISEEPIVCGNEEALRRLAGIADGFLFHDREIESRCDDSVARIVAGGPVLLRRSRGWVPRPMSP